MSTDPKILLDAIIPGKGRALDLGGGSGAMGKPLEGKGYSYTNLDVRKSQAESLVVGDAHSLPFGHETFAIVVSNDSLEHFVRPHEVVQEVCRVLEPGGHFVAHVPFIHAFHGDDTYRYTPHGLRYLLEDGAGLEIVRLESPQWVFTILGHAAVGVLKKVGIPVAESRIRGAMRIMDSWIVRSKTRSFAASYLVDAQKAKEVTDSIGA